MNRPGAAVPLTPAQLAELERNAIPATGMAISPAGDVLVSGRHALGLSDVVIRVAPEDVLSLASALATMALATVRQLNAAAAQRPQ